MNSNDFKHLAEIRFREAHALLSAGFYEGAYYLAGYSVECALKACIAKRTLEFDFPDKKLANESHTHNLIELMRLSQLDQLLKSSMQADASFEVRWKIVQNWSEASRYQIREDWEAESLINAIEDNSGGLLPWIRLHW